MGKIKTPRKCSRWHPIVSTRRGRCTNHSCVNGSVGLHHTETTGVYDTSKNSPAVLHELQNEVDHWKAIWEMENVAEKPDTLDNSINQPWPMLQHVHCCHSTDGDVCIDSHGQSPLQRYAASQELSALYNDNWTHVGTGLDARPQGHRVGCWTHHSSVQSSEEQALSPNISPLMKVGTVTELMLQTIQYSLACSISLWYIVT